MTKYDIGINKDLKMRIYSKGYRIIKERFDNNKTDIVKPRTTGKPVHLG